MSKMTLEQLWQDDVVAAQAGDVQAFSRLVQRSQATVSSIALAIVKDFDASADVSQQVFIHAWRKLSTLHNPLSFLPWLRQITRNRAFNYLRDSKAQHIERGEQAEALLDEVCSGEDVFATLSDEQQQLAMRSFIEQLPDDSRELVLLFYREQQNSQQVAELLGMTDANARKKLQRVRDLLKAQWLAKFGELASVTAPGLAFSSVVTGLLVAAAPPAAAATTASVLSVASPPGSQSGVLKSLVMLGGAMLGSFLALLAVWWGSKQAIAQQSQPQLKLQLLQLRNVTIVLVLCTGLLLTAAYELTQGAWAPLTVMVLFLAILTGVQWRWWQLQLPDLQQQAQFAENADAWLRQQALRCWSGMVIGGTAGLLGMILGLVNSGRW